MVFLINVLARSAGFFFFFFVSGDQSRERGRYKLVGVNQNRARGGYKLVGVNQNQAKPISSSTFTKKPSYKRVRGRHARLKDMSRSDDGDDVAVQYDCALIAPRC